MLISNDELFFGFLFQKSSFDKSGFFFFLQKISLFSGGKSILGTFSISKWIQILRLNPI